MHTSLSRDNEDMDDSLKIRRRNRDSIKHIKKAKEHAQIYSIVTIHPYPFNICT